MSTEILTLTLLFVIACSNLLIAYYFVFGRKDEVEITGTLEEAQNEPQQATEQGKVTLYEWQPPKTEEQVLFEETLKKIRNA